jgi:hypothetical protein
MKNRILITLITLVSLSATAAIQLKSNPKDGMVEFEAIGRPSMLKIKGVGEGVTSNLQFENSMLTGDIRFSLKSLKTGIELRDEHLLNKYLQVSQFAEAKLIFNRFNLPKDFSIANPAVTNQPFKALLNLHGVQKEVSGFYSVTTANLVSKATFEIKLSDFNIEIPSYLGIKVADMVKIKVSLNKLMKVN